MTEQQQYDVISRFDHIELRRYAACVVADIVVTGSAERAGNAAFRPLVSYISGANAGGDRLAMTAPVVQEAVGESLTMTEPVLQEPRGNEDSWTVSFVLPDSRPIENYPVPTDPRIHLRAVPAEVAAVVRWSGRWTADNVAMRTAELQQAMASHGWTATGSPRWARFDPPWKPPFARRNEIVIPVAG